MSDSNIDFFGLDQRLAGFSEDALSLNNISTDFYDGPKFNEDDENELLRILNSNATPNYKDYHKQHQTELKRFDRDIISRRSCRVDRDKSHYESEATSEDAQVENEGNVDFKLKEIQRICQWSSSNQLWHIQAGKRGLIEIKATFKGIQADPCVEEYMVRNTLIRARPAHRQYPVDCVCLIHKGSTEEDVHQVLQAKPGTSPDKFWYTYGGLRKSVIFEAPRPDEGGNISLDMKLCTVCCDSCDAASDKYLRLIDQAGKEAGRDWLLVSTLEARKDEKQYILARRVTPCWFKAAVVPRDLVKKERRKIKGGGAQKISRLKKLQASSLVPPPPNGKQLSNTTPDHDYVSISPEVITMDWQFHADILKQYLANDLITKQQLEQRLFGGQ